MNEEESRLYASYSEFYIQDSEPVGTAADETFWTPEAGDNRMAIGDGILAVGTSSYAMVKVRVEDHDSEPPLDLSQWDHVTEATLVFRSKLLLVSGCLSSSGLFFQMEPGSYRVRCCHANLVESETEGWTGEGDPGDWYSVHFWPAAYAPPTVLKRRRGREADLRMAELEPGLKLILDSELAAGNEVLQVYKHEAKILVVLRLSFRKSWTRPPYGVAIRQTDDPRYSYKIAYVDKQSGNTLECRPARAE